ncbi:MAG: hypothetical protein MZU97_13150 [Bacillus subtilis]|nr:hypothetical protein [Bacillus subtilis]
MIMNEIWILVALVEPAVDDEAVQLRPDREGPHEGGHDQIHIGEAAAEMAFLEDPLVHPAAFHFQRREHVGVVPFFHDVRHEFGDRVDRLDDLSVASTSEHGNPPEKQSEMMIPHLRGQFKF